MSRPTALNKDRWPKDGRLIAAVAVLLLIAIMALLPDVAKADGAPVAAPPGPAPSVDGMEIRARLSTADLQVAGVRLNRWLLWHLYAAYGFEPIWGSRQREAAALQNAVLRADEHGLDPNLFHAAVIARAAALSPADRDLLLSDMFLAYADALARGAVPIEQRRHDDEALEPGPVDVVAALQAAIAAPDPGRALDALAPASPAYARLRQAYAGYRTSGLQREARLVAVNLERLRWLPRAMPADRVEVNAASAQLQLFRGSVPVFTTRVVVGEPDKQTPEMQAQIESILFNPPWYVPYSIAVKEILPRQRSDPGYLARHNMVLGSGGSIMQRPGAGSSLGQLKFEMPNPFDVYLHDTPLKGLFARDDRRQSHGCVRVENPRELASLLLQEPVGSVNEAISAGSTNREYLPTALPVFIVYQTVSVGPDGSVQFLADPYGRDQEIADQLGGSAPIGALPAQPQLRSPIAAAR
jgi:murein L,D-transpeptidase YcbB/YkuD